MRIFSYLLMLFGILALAGSGYDEYHGATHSPSNGANRYSSLTGSDDLLLKASNPEQFHNAMLVHWFRSSSVLLLGVILFMINRGQDKVDPMSPDYAGNKDLDDWSDELKKDEEQRKHQKP